MSYNWLNREPLTERTTMSLTLVHIQATFRSTLAGGTTEAIECAFGIEFDSENADLLTRDLGLALGALRAALAFDQEEAAVR